MSVATRQHKSARAYGFKAVDGAPAGTFEAIVSVFGNVDYGGDRVVAGAFADSLKTWQASGDPIPVIFSHQWDNLDAHVGQAEPGDVKELLPGDPLLPPELTDLGGLYVKGSLAIEEDFAGRLWKRMSSRAIKEFSFAYDVGQARPAADGALDLLKLDLIELGPTLKGMNPATALIAAKTARGPLEALEAADALAVDLAERVKAVDEELEPDPPAPDPAPEADPPKEPEPEPDPPAEPDEAKAELVELVRGVVLEELERAGAAKATPKTPPASTIPPTSSGKTDEALEPKVEDPKTAKTMSPALALARATAEALELP